MDFIIQKPSSQSNDSCEFEQDTPTQNIYLSSAVSNVSININSPLIQEDYKMTLIEDFAEQQQDYSQDIEKRINQFLDNQGIKMSDPTQKEDDYYQSKRTILLQKKTSNVSFDIDSIQSLSNSKPQETPKSCGLTLGKSKLFRKRSENLTEKLGVQTRSRKDTMPSTPSSSFTLPLDESISTSCSSSKSKSNTDIKTLSLLKQQLNLSLMVSQTSLINEDDAEGNQSVLSSKKIMFTDNIRTKQQTLD